MNIFKVFLTGIAFVCLSISVKAQVIDEKIATTGDCGANGNNLTWVLLTYDSLLTISGSGAMADFESEKSTPWYDYRYLVKTVIIGNEVTNIGDNAFYHCIKMRSIVIGDAVTTIGEAAFFHCRSLESIIIPNSVTTIGRIAFSGCMSLAEAVIPESVILGESAFGGCKKMQR